MSIYNKEVKENNALKVNKFSVRQMAIAGMLGGMSIVMSMTPIGYIPLPFLGINATTMHIPVIIGAILGGPMIGTLVGAIFGISSLMRVSAPFFADPRVAILPRLFIGVMSYYTYKLSKSSILAAIMGTAMNTLGVLSMVYFLGYLPLEAVLGVAAVNGVAEILISSLIVHAVVKGVKKINKHN